MKQFDRQNGFTMMEVAVVLAVISLLVFSLLKGQEMVHQSRLRKAIKQVEDIRTAANLFYRNTGRWPGDGRSGITCSVVSLADGWIDKPDGFGAEAECFIYELVNERYLTGKNKVKWTHSLGSQGEIWVDYFANPGLSENWVILTDVIRADDRKALNAVFDGDGDDKLDVGRVQVSNTTTVWIAL